MNQTKTHTTHSYLSKSWHPTFWRFIDRPPPTPCPHTPRYHRRNRFYGCSGRPLCKATRRARKNGAIIELEVEERQPHASSACSRSSRGASTSDNSEESGITRYCSAASKRVLVPNHNGISRYSSSRSVLIPNHGGTTT